MDNVCHALAGAALGYAGLTRRTPLAIGTLVIGANLPDVDVLAVLARAPMVAFRRGWTHGVLALGLWPFILTLLVVAWDRRVRRRRQPDLPRAMPSEIYRLAAVAVLSHPLLDLMNTYGVRLLMPFSGRWFYGDTLFIVDPWLWLALGAGVWLSRRALRGGAAHPWRAARVALVVATVYIVAMAASSLVGRRLVEEAWAREGRGEPWYVMVSPAPVNPFARTLVVANRAGYTRGTLTWWPHPVVSFDEVPWPTRSRHPAAVAARQTSVFRAFLVWSRFPFYRLEAVPGGARVTLGDMRFADGGLRSRGFSVSTVVRGISVGDAVGDDTEPSGY